MPRAGQPFQFRLEGDGSGNAARSSGFAITRQRVPALYFPTLVFTGFALKYPDSWWSAPFVL